ncbi:hypothetical protein BAUCODRAFT_125438 [Baudoinia panamericana UAMH 10762]|uniref:Uncharacterized protein n=1 Tax=Baudoinia panamericana (strain UAMH 10762) TaxID=717646 RepID=M2MAU8_BAUPA|nr:uncharacterized protein BAUCODRAFT_125438 [Baudoinia panamericana UAMH 10762]EMC93591.1 hypothetical protein BAUCODRAFT_125438 [Baudoinia panamericana UAMH 10762]
MVEVLHVVDSILVGLGSYRCRTTIAGELNSAEGGPFGFEVNHIRPSLPNRFRTARAHAVDTSSAQHKPITKYSRSSHPSKIV